MEPHDQNYLQRVSGIFEDAPFIADLGIMLAEVGAGRCVTTLDLLPRHHQQNGYAHAGVLATIADHTAGAAAATLVGPQQTVLSVEFKINMLRPAVGQALRCVAQVLKAGRTLIVAEAEVYAVDGERSRLVSKATVTLAVVGTAELPAGIREPTAG